MEHTWGGRAGRAGGRRRGPGLQTPPPGSARHTGCGRDAGLSPALSFPEARRGQLRTFYALGTGTTEKALLPQPDSSKCRFPCDLFIAFISTCCLKIISALRSLRADCLGFVCSGIGAHPSVQAPAREDVSPRQGPRVVRVPVLRLTCHRSKWSFLLLQGQRGSHRLGSAGIRGPSVASQVPGSGASGPLGLAQPQPDVN